jgi:3-oxoadipate enol-lactonase
MPVVFLHPTPIDHAYWVPVVDRLEGVRAIMPDLRGHGASELGSGLPLGAFARVPEAPALTMAQLATDMVALLDRLNLRQAVFIGCSIGGYVMLELVRRIPRRMRGLGFVCSKPQPDADANFAKRADTIARARAGEKDALFDSMAQTSIGATARRLRPEIVQQMRMRMTMSAQAIVSVQAGLAARPNSVPTIRNITAPVLAIAGGEDLAVSPSEMEAFRQAPGGCVSHLLSDAGHFAAYEQPDIVAGIVSDWLKPLGR